MFSKEYGGINNVLYDEFAEDLSGKVTINGQKYTIFCRHGRKYIEYVRKKGSPTEKVSYVGLLVKDGYVTLCGNKLVKMKSKETDEYMNYLIDGLLNKEVRELPTVA